MARFLSRRIVHPKTGQAYDIAIELDRIAALRESLVVEISARRWTGPDGGGQEVSATLTLDIEKREILVEIEGEEVGRISFDAAAVANADAADVEDVHGEGTGEGFEDQAWQAVRDNLLSESGDRMAGLAEEIIEAIPAIDPVLGCLLKGAISATAGQIIRCHGELPDWAETAPQKIRGIIRCLGDNMWGMLGRASWRALRCMARMGW